VSPAQFGSTAEILRTWVHPDEECTDRREPITGPGSRGGAAGAGSSTVIDEAMGRCLGSPTSGWGSPRPAWSTLRCRGSSTGPTARAAASRSGSQPRCPTSSRPLAGRRLRAGSPPEPPAPAPGSPPLSKQSRATGGAASCRGVAGPLLERPPLLTSLRRRQCLGREGSRPGSLPTGRPPGQARTTQVHRRIARRRPRSGRRRASSLCSGSSHGRRSTTARARKVSHAQQRGIAR